MTMSAHTSRADHLSGPSELRAQVDTLGRAVYDRVADTPTPRLDRLLVGLSKAANHSRLWLAVAAAVAALGGGRGRRAACQGVLAVALTSAVTNLILKNLARRQRPARLDNQPTPHSRRVRPPVSPSFPSGHAASAFAFASATGHALPSVRMPLLAAAATVAYSRVHTDVHYPSDVAIGAVVGELCAGVAQRLTTHLTGCAAAKT
jgi:undecaprenyl-diphosphatase